MVRCIPRRKALEAERADLDQKIAQEVDRLAGSVASDVSVARAHLNSLEASLGGVVHQQTAQNMARVELDALQSNAASTRTQYEAFVGRLRQTQDQDATVTPDSRVISSASVPTAPASPKRTLIVLASIPFGLLIGLMAVLLRERFNALPAFRALPAPLDARAMPAFRTAPRRAPSFLESGPVPPGPARRSWPTSPIWFR